MASCYEKDTRITDAEFSLSNGNGYPILEKQTPRSFAGLTDMLSSGIGSPKPLMYSTLEGVQKRQTANETRIVPNSNNNNKAKMNFQFLSTSTKGPTGDIARYGY